MSHYNMVHKPIHIPTAMTNLEAKAALEMKRTKLRKLPACDKSKVTSNAEVTRRGKLEGKKILFATVMDLCHLKNSELERKFQRYRGRVVFER